MFEIKSFRSRIGLYYVMIKPGIVYSNVMMAAAGYLLASKWHLHWQILPLLVGTGLVIASACVFNNYLDRSIDKKMARTKTRALASGQIAGQTALIYATGLGLVGFFMLIFTKWLVVVLGLAAIFSYVVLYGIAKRRSVHGTLVGTLPGSAALVAGYVAAKGQLDLGALILFLIMLTWQMAHFYAIATYRINDYTLAGLPVWPVKKGIRSTKRLIAVYVLAFIVMVILLSLFHYTGYVFALIMAALGLYWLYFVLKGFSDRDSTRWGRRVFLRSLVVLLALSVMLSVGNVLP